MFINRKDAGQQLGKALEKYRIMHPIVLGVPRGGVEVAYYVALYLNCDFDTVVARKLGYPQQPEAAFGAVAEDGSLYLDPFSDKYLSKKIIEDVASYEQKEIERRIQKYRHGRPSPDLKNRVVILVDDGIASGATIFAAIAMCRKQQPQKLVVAVPVSGQKKLPKLKVKADDLVILEIRDQFFAVSEGYRDFTNLTDNYVQHYLDLWQKRTGSEVPPKR